MITTKEINKLTRLAKLNFSSEEISSFAHKLNSVIKMIDTLKEVDCTGAEPLRSVSDMQQRLREDKVASGDLSEELFQNVPESGGDLAKEVKCFVVPKVVE